MCGRENLVAELPHPDRGAVVAPRLLLVQEIAEPPQHQGPRQGQLPLLGVLQHPYRVLHPGHPEPGVGHLGEDAGGGIPFEFEFTK